MPFWIKNKIVLCQVELTNGLEAIQDRVLGGSHCIYIHVHMQKCLGEPRSLTYKTKLSLHPRAIGCVHSFLYS
jgi:hypothetical protein